MGFFAEFSRWLNAILNTYIANHLSIVAAALEPVGVTLGTIYVMVWGYLSLTGQIQEPFTEGVRRIGMLALVLGLALKLWLYNDLVVDTFFNAPGALAATIIGSYDAVTIVDTIIDLGADTAELLLQKGGLINGLSFSLAGLLVYVVVALTAVYTIFLLTLSKIALSVLLALGPLFLIALLFPTTKRYFEAWLSQLSNYAFITLLTVLLSALMLTLLKTAAEQAAAAGSGVQIAQAARVCMAAALTFLVMRQVMPMAASLASGLSLSSFGWMSALIAWGFGRTVRGTGQFARGLIDRETSRWDPVSRKTGFYVARGVAAGVHRLTRRPNSVRAA